MLYVICYIMWCVRLLASLVLLLAIEQSIRQCCILLRCASVSALAAWLPQHLVLCVRVSDCLLLLLLCDRWLGASVRVQHWPCLQLSLSPHLLSLLSQANAFVHGLRISHLHLYAGDWLLEEGSAAQVSASGRALLALAYSCAG